MTSDPSTSEIGIGPTDELSLRVSVGALARVLFEHPRDGEIMLALERKATVLHSEGGQVVDVKSQPFGGALRLLRPQLPMHDRTTHAISSSRLARGRTGPGRRARCCAGEVRLSIGRVGEAEQVAAPGLDERRVL